MRAGNGVLEANKTNISNNEYIKFIYGNLNSYCNDFRAAVNLFEVKSTDKALHYFQLAYESVNRNDVYHNLYESYCGLVRLLSGDRGGLELCRDAARSEQRNANVFLNLARAEWHYRNRKKTIIALENGLKINRKHPGILKMREELGVRRRKIIPMIHRNSAINNTLGKILRKS